VKRWWPVLLAVPAVALAVFVMRPTQEPSESVREPAEVRRPRAPATGEPRDVPPGAVKGPPGAGAIGGEGWTPAPGSVPAQLADPSLPPEVRAAAAVSGEWGRLARWVRYSPGDATEEWVALDDEVNDLSSKLRIYRADPASGSWPALVAEQRALLPRLRALGPNDDQAAAIAAIEQQLATWP
jgi:hypothetical protein